MKDVIKRLWRVMWRVNTHTFALAEFFRSAAQMSRRRLDCCQTLKFKVNISFSKRKRLHFSYLFTFSDDAI
jgi:hypothetical protein